MLPILIPIIELTLLPQVKGLIQTTIKAMGKQKFSTLTVCNPGSQSYNYDVTLTLGLLRHLVILTSSSWTYTIVFN